MATINAIAHLNELTKDVTDDSERLKVSVNLTQGDTARKAVVHAVVHAYEQAGATGPVIQSVMDPTENKTDHLNPGSMALIQGMRLSVRGDNPAVGTRSAIREKAAHSIIQ